MAERIYGPEQIIEEEGQLKLIVRLGGEDFKLPITHFDKSGEDVWVAFLNPNPSVNCDLCKAMAEEMAKLFIRLKAEVVAMPTSSKSETGIKNAVKLASQLLGYEVLLITLMGTKRDNNGKIIVSEDDLRKECQHIIGYTPITSRGEKKFLGIKSGDIELLKKKCPTGEGIVLADDVYTTGATLEAVRVIINETLGFFKSCVYPIVVLAEEMEFTPFNSVYFVNPSPSNVHSAIRIPEFIGKLPIRQAEITIYREKEVNKFEKKESHQWVAVCNCREGAKKWFSGDQQRLLKRVDEHIELHKNRDHIKTIIKFLAENQPRNLLCF